MCSAAWGAIAHYVSRPRPFYSQVVAFDYIYIQITRTYTESICSYCYTKTIPKLPCIPTYIQYIYSPTCTAALLSYQVNINIS